MTCDNFFPENLGPCWPWHWARLLGGGYAMCLVARTFPKQYVFVDFDYAQSVQYMSWPPSWNRWWYFDKNGCNLIFSLGDTVVTELKLPTQSQRALFWNASSQWNARLAFWNAMSSLTLRASLNIFNRQTLDLSLSITVWVPTAQISPPVAACRPWSFTNDTGRYRPMRSGWWKGAKEAHRRPLGSPQWWGERW